MVVHSGGGGEEFISTFASHHAEYIEINCIMPSILSVHIATSSNNNHARFQGYIGAMYILVSRDYFAILKFEM